VLLSVGGVLVVRFVFMVSARWCLSRPVGYWFQHGGVRDFRLCSWFQHGVVLSSDCAVGFSMVYQSLNYDGFNAVWSSLQIMFSVSVRCVVEFRLSCRFQHSVNCLRIALLVSACSVLVSRLC
jgi:hypothetical protein